MKDPGCISKAPFPPGALGFSQPYAEFGASQFWFFNVTFAVNPQPERGRAPKRNDLFLGNSAPVYPQAALA